jgi:hypothetical protein
LEKRQTDINGRYVNKHEDHAFNNMVHGYPKDVFAVLETFIIYGLK